MFLLPHILERARANLIVAVYSATHWHPAIMQLRGNHIERPECKSLKEVLAEIPQIALFANSSSGIPVLEHG